MYLHSMEKLSAKVYTIKCILKLPGVAVAVSMLLIREGLGSAYLHAFLSQ